ncbi:MAG: hypothetical protein HYY46_14105 [Deltaproteobacteria bacterium]|nr:hypothetical protein [Deltaproteobacteria bacterium]
MDLLKPKARSSHPLQWVIEPLEEEPSFIAKAMFGCVGCYLHGRLVLVLAARRHEPWMGLLVPTEKNHHTSLRREHHGLVTHPILKKWLYLPESNDEFEERARALVESIVANDLRIGVEPTRKKTRERKSRGKPFPQSGGKIPDRHGKF